VGLLFFPAAGRLAGFIILGMAELWVPIWAERAAVTSWGWPPGQLAGGVALCCPGHSYSDDWGHFIDPF